MGQFESGKRRPEMKKRSKELPAHVKHAVLKGDVEQLRASGKRGAEVTNDIKAQKAEAKAYFDGKLQQREEERRRETNEHILPLDPDTDTEELNA